MKVFRFCDSCQDGCGYFVIDGINDVSPICAKGGVGFGIAVGGGLLGGDIDVFKYGKEKKDREDGHEP